MTGINPAIAAMYEAREEFDNLVRNMNPELIRNIQDKKVSETDKSSALVQRAVAVWESCTVEINDGTIDYTSRMA